MNEPKLEIKLSFIAGLERVVLKEINQCPDFHVAKKNENSFYLDFTRDLANIKRLRSVSQAYIVIQDFKYNPLYISKHKSILGNIIEIIINENRNAFKTFKITCAGSSSSEVRSIAEYIQKTYGLIKREKADTKIHIIKIGNVWEIGAQITPRPLSVRDYKAKNMSGAMDSTIAYALNSFCELEKAKSYLNIFSGSATLLIEAGQCYSNLERLIGFDNSKKHLSLAMQNIKKAKLVTKIQLKEKDIFDKPNLGIFDAITSDLPFGMAISKGENLKALYQCFIEYCENTLSKEGKLAIYTSEYEILEKIILGSRFHVIKKLELKFITNVNAYLKPKIFVCKLKS